MLDVSQFLQEITCRSDEEVKEAFAARLGGDGRIVLWGAGMLGRTYAATLRTSGVEVLAFADETPGKWGTVIEGVPVLEPGEAVDRFGATATFVVSIWNPVHRYLDTEKKLHALGCVHVVSFLHVAYAHPDLFLPHYQFDRVSQMARSARGIQRALDILADDQSRSELLAHLKFRATLDFELLPPNDPVKYFRSDLFPILPSDAVLFDGGAFDGDTLRAFLEFQNGAFRRAVAIEPDPSNYARLAQYVASLPIDAREKVTPLNAALGERRETRMFDAQGTLGGALTTSGDAAVQVLGLPDVAEQFGAPTFVKLDIEGAEQDVIRGGSDTIRTSTPAMAICVYHRPDDLWTIPSLLSDLDSEYQIKLRTEGDDGMGMVCYAVPRRFNRDL